MNEARNKQLMQDVFAELAQGNGTPFRACLADDVRWHMIGTTAWSGTYEGKDAVENRLLAPLYAQFESRYSNRARRFVADGDVVVVEGRGSVTTKRGEPYDNTYCFVFRLEDGKVKELTEYMDTALVDSALDPPGQVAA